MFDLTDVVRFSISESGVNIIIFRDEFEVLSRKVEELEKFVEMKVVVVIV